MNKVKLKAIHVREYWANPEHYDGCNTPEEMAALDSQNYPPDIMDHEDSVFTVVVSEDQE